MNNGISYKTTLKNKTMEQWFTDDTKEEKKIKVSAKN